MKSCKVNVGLLGLLLMGVVHQADAEVYEFTNGADGTVMATLELTETATVNNYLFELAFLSNAGRNNFSNLDFLAIKTATADPSTSLVSYSDTTTADTPVVVTQDGTANGTILNLSFDYNHAFDFADNTVTNGPVANQMNSIVVGESVQWVASYSEPLIVESAVVVFRNNGGNNPNFFDNNVTAAVPEPETYAMFLAGLGLLGFAARQNAKR